MNNKILSVVLVVGVATTGFAGLSSASVSENSFLNKGNSEMREIKEKLESGIELTEAEQTILDTAKAEREENSSHKGGKRKGGANLTDEEKASLETMSDEEKQAFFTAKKEEMNAAKQAKADVVTALIAGETLTAEQENIRAELLEKSQTAIAAGKEAKPGKEVILKLLSGETLTAEDEASIAEMQAKKEEREANESNKKGNKGGAKGDRENTQEK